MVTECMLKKQEESKDPFAILNLKLQLIDVNKDFYIFGVDVDENSKKLLMMEI